MEGIVIVRVIPVNRALRHIAAVIKFGHPAHGPGYCLLDLWIVGMQYAIRGYHVPATISHIVNREGTYRVDPVSAYLQGPAIGAAHSLVAQFLLHWLEEVDEFVKFVWDVRYFIAGFFHQRFPNMKCRGRCLHRNSVIAA